MSSRLGLAPVLAVLLVFFGGIVPSGKSQTVLSRTLVIKYVIDPKQVDYVVNLFKSRLLLQDHDAGIIGCKNVTRIAVGGAKDFAVGASCAVRRGNNTFSALMCEDSRYGRLICTQSRAPAREEVIEFIKGNCLPAGSR